MEEAMARKTVNKKLIWAAVVIVIAAVLAVFGILKWNEKKAGEAEWAQAYMKECGPFALAYEDWPGDMESWREWQPDWDTLEKLTDNGNGAIGKNELKTLAGAYSLLMQINVADPTNSQCRELYGRLEPYFQKAFVWGPDTPGDECLQRLKGLGSETAMEEIGSLYEEAQALYESCGASRWFTVATSGNLEMPPEEYVSSSGDMQVAPREYVSSDSDLQVDP